jgi:hypothetical protein
MCKVSPRVTEGPLAHVSRQLSSPTNVFVRLDANSLIAFALLALRVLSVGESYQSSMAKLNSTFNVIGSPHPYRCSSTNRYAHRP